MTPEEILKHIQSLSTIVGAIGKRDKDAVAKLNEVYKMVYGHTISFGCKNCVHKAYFKLSSLTLQKIKQMQESKFKLKPGIRINYPAFSANYYTTENMTDEIAVKMLSKTPGLISNFKEYPKDENGEPLLTQVSDEDENTLKTDSKSKKGKKADADPESQELNDLRKQYKELKGEDPAEELTAEDLKSLIEELNK